MDIHRRRLFPCRRMLPQGWSPIKYCSRLITRQSPNDRMTSSITTSNRAPPRFVRKAGTWMERLISHLVETRHANSTWRREFFSIHRESSVPKPIVHNIVADPVPALSPRSSSCIGYPCFHSSGRSSHRHRVWAAFCPYAFAENTAPVSSLDGQHSVIGAVKASQLAGRRGLPSPLSLPKRRSPVMVKHFICPQPRGKGCRQHPKHEAGLPPLWRNGWRFRTSFPPRTSSST